MGMRPPQQQQWQGKGWRRRLAPPSHCIRRAIMYIYIYIYICVESSLSGSTGGLSQRGLDLSIAALAEAARSPPLELGY